MNIKQNLLALSLLIFIAFGANAQKTDEYNPIKVDISLGYAMPGGTGAKGGGLFSAEPKYEVIKNLAVGLRMEIAIMARGIANSSTTNNLEIKGSGSYLATGDYYFSSTRSFRPFAGVGIGLYRLAAATTANSGSDVSKVTSKFGEMIRAGMEIGHFRLGVEYNFVPDAEMYLSSSSSTKATFKNGYMGIKLGFCFGGNKK